MGKNEIKLRRRPLDPADILRYHNYPALMKRHKRSRRLKRVVRFFTFSLIIAVIVLLFLIIVSYLWFGVKKRGEQRKEKEHTTTQPVQSRKDETRLINR
jgi:cell division protein FtsN